MMHVRTESEVVINNFAFRSKLRRAFKKVEQRHIGLIFKIALPGVRFFLALSHSVRKSDDESQEDEEYEEDDDKENVPSPSTALVVTIIVPSSSVSNGGGNTPILKPTATIVLTDSSDPKWRCLELIEEKKPPPSLDDSQRLLQRLWTDEDEIKLLQGFLDYTLQRGSSHHNDTTLFYDQIKSKLQLNFNKNQLVEKIRRLKKKYRNVLNKICSDKEFSFKSTHDQATFEISRKIWSNVTPVVDNSLDDDEINPNRSPNPNLNFSPVILKNETIFKNSTEKKTPKHSRR
ncbi:putative transcription factor [Glycine max]|nr:putative transcription factor [Glycine max]